MRKHWLILGLTCCLAAHAVATERDYPAAGRERDTFDFGWRFHDGDRPGAEAPAFDDAAWREVDLPHDWSIEKGFHPGAAGGWRGGYVHLGTGWYRKTFTAPATFKGQRVYLCFDGIYKNSDVYINGHHLGNRWYGYVPFRYDLTPHLKLNAPNVITVRVHTPKQTCRWYTGAGIYRHTWLETTDPLAVDYRGVFVTTPFVADDAATARIQTTVTNSHATAQACNLVTAIVDPQGKVVATYESKREIPSGSAHTFEQDLTVRNPRLWSADTPAMYTVKTVVQSGGKRRDACTTPFGIRTLNWDPTAHGLVVNGKAEFLNGVNIHHDLGSLGAAFNARAMERRLELLKEMGCNAIRMAHNPPASELLDMCDRLGFYVINEAFDKWGPDHYTTFEQDWPRDLKAMIRRDRNHPSIVLWSLGNENWAQKWPRSRNIYNAMVKVAQQHDDTRKFTFACSPGDFVNEARIMDVASLNYHEGLLDGYLKELPTKCILISEAYNYWSGKDGKAEAYHPVTPTVMVWPHAQVAGTFLWTGIEYLGEAKAKWPQHGWNGNPIDTCALRKPVGYLHQSLWSDTPMVHIAVVSDQIKMPRFSNKHWGWPNMASHWTFPQLEDQTVEIKAFSNCDAVELLVNGTSLGRQRLADFDDQMIRWTDVPYAKGEVRAIGFKNGRQVCSHQLRTAGPPTRLVLSPDRVNLKADRRDISHVLVTIVDADGTVVPNATHKVTFDVTGPGTLRAMDNGDSFCTEPYQVSTRSSYEGRNMGLVQAGDEPGAITVTATADGLQSAVTIIQSR